jgi:hypothetical protein
MANFSSEKFRRLKYRIGDLARMFFVKNKYSPLKLVAKVSVFCSKIFINHTDYEHEHP